MNDLIKFTRNSYKNENDDTLWYEIYEWIKTKKYISILPLKTNRKKYFLFVFKGRILYLSEFSLCLILCSLTLIGVIGIRKLVKRLKLKKKIRKLINRIRAGANLVDENDILHYEDDLNDLINYHPIAVSHFKLTARQKMIKARSHVQDN